MGKYRDGNGIKVFYFWNSSWNNSPNKYINTSNGRYRQNPPPTWILVARDGSR